MKKIILFAATLFAAGAMMAQTIVSTEPSNKNVILEEYTGVNCGYCPDGHRIGNEIMAENPGRAFAINIHQGGYAASYSTPWGDALAGQTGLNGYPSGTINRHKFSGSNTALDRGSWKTKANVILAQASPVNVAAVVTIDTALRTMAVMVEAYYTANSAAATNQLNVALLQDNILGNQQGGSNFNPSQVVGSKYRHMHMLRDLITGQWGVTIPTTTAGTFYTQTFVYAIPEHMYDADVVIEDLNVIAFIAEGHQEILTGCEAEIVYGELDLPAAVTSLTYTPSNDCEVAFNVGAVVANPSHDTIHNMEITYTVNNSTDVIDWEGELLPGAIETIELPLIESEDFVSGSTYVLEAGVTGIDGEAVEGSTSSVDLTKTIYTAEGPLKLIIATDKYASETTFDFTAVDGTPVVAGGPWANASGVVKRIYNLDPAAGCYILTVYDEYGDGINNGYGAGYITLSNAAGQVFRNNGDFGKQVSFYINVTSNGSGEVGIDDVAAANISLYPNPATSLLNIESNQTIREVVVFDMAGRNVMSLEGDIHQIATSNLSNGIYTIRVITENGMATQKFVKE